MPSTRLLPLIVLALAALWIGWQVRLSPSTTPTLYAQSTAQDTSTRWRDTLLTQAKPSSGTTRLDGVFHTLSQELQAYSQATETLTFYTWNSEHAHWWPLPNGDVIVTLLPVNERFPWVTPARFRPELVPEELMAPVLTVRTHQPLMHCMTANK